MAKNFKNKLIGQIGEHLVVAELGRRGIVATPLAGNVPDIDILAYANERALAIQVKTIASGAWQLDLRNLLEIELIGKQQVIKGKSKEVNQNRLNVFIRLGEKPGDDRFYIFKMGFLQDKVLANHRSFLAKHNGIRPRSPESMHTIVLEKDLERKCDNWGLILRAFKI